MTSLWCLIFSFSIFIPLTAFTVRGKLLCHGEPWSNKSVTAMAQKPLTVETLAETRTDSEGNFMLNATQSDAFFQKPYVFVQHECESRSEGGRNFPEAVDLSIELLRTPRNLQIHVPERYLTSGEWANKIHELPTVELSARIYEPGLFCPYRKGR